MRDRRRLSPGVQPQEGEAQFITKTNEVFQEGDQVGHQHAQADGRGHASYSCAILKCHLEYLRANHKKALRLMIAPDGGAGAAGLGPPPPAMGEGGTKLPSHSKRV